MTVHAIKIYECTHNVQQSCFETIAKTLIGGMLCKDTARRLTARGVLNDAWFTVSNMYVTHIHVRTVTCVF